MNATEHESSREESLVQDLKAVLQAAEEFAATSVRETGEKLAETRKKLESTLKDVRRRVDNAEALLIAKTKVAAASTDAYVRSNPWKSVGVGVAIGLIVGLLIARR